MNRPPDATKGLQALIGHSVNAVDTPALVVDLDAMQRNLQRMAAFAREHGLRWRPHAKMHKSAQIAQWQMQAGAVGVCVQKTAEAEALFAAGGVLDIYISNEVIAPHKLARVATLARRLKAQGGQLAIAVDSLQGVQALAPPRRGAYELMGQRHCCDAPAGQYVPAEQLPHDDDPGPEEYLPAVQGVQRVAPTLGEYVPGSHNRGLTSPALGQKLPAGQALHVLLLGAPMESDDVPFGQRSRTLDEALQLELPHGAYLPAGARWHTEVSLE